MAQTELVKLGGVLDTFRRSAVKRKRGVGTRGIDLPLTEMGMAESNCGNADHVSKISKWTCRIGS